MLGSARERPRRSVPGGTSDGDCERPARRVAAGASAPTVRRLCRAGTTWLARSPGSVRAAVAERSAGRDRRAGGGIRQRTALHFSCVSIYTQPYETTRQIVRAHTFSRIALPATARRVSASGEAPRSAAVACARLGQRCGAENARRKHHIHLDAKGPSEDRDRRSIRSAGRSLSRGHRRQSPSGRDPCPAARSQSNGSARRCARRVKTTRQFSPKTKAPTCPKGGLSQCHSSLIE